MFYSHQWMMMSSTFIALELNFNIFVTADMAFSVGLTFSGALLFGAFIISINLGIA